MFATKVYIRNCGKHRIELGQQMFVMRRLEHVAEEVAKGESKDARKSILRSRLSEIVLPATFKLPLNPHLTVITIYPFYQHPFNQHFKTGLWN